MSTSGCCQSTEKARQKCWPMFTADKGLSTPRPGHPIANELLLSATAIWEPTKNNDCHMKPPGSIWPLKNYYATYEKKRFSESLRFYGCGHAAPAGTGPRRRKHPGKRRRYPAVHCAQGNVGRSG